MSASLENSTVATGLEKVWFYSNPQKMQCHSNSCPLSRWCRSIIWSSVIPFSSCLQSFPALGSFPMNLFASGGQSIGASASILPVNIQDWFKIDRFDLTAVQRDSQESSPTPQFKSINSSALSFLYGPTITSIHDYLEKPQLRPARPLSAK